MANIYIVNGPPGAGKSTASEAAARLLKKSAFIDGDYIYHFVCSGMVKPWLPGNQKPLFWKNAFCIMDNFLQEGYDIVFTYVFSEEEFDRIARYFEGRAQVRFITLVVREDVLRYRDEHRPADERMGERCVTVLRDFLEKKRGVLEPYFLDTSDQSVEQTAKAILVLARQWPSTLPQKGDKP